MKLQSIFLLLALLTASFLQAAMAGSGVCDTKCGARCSKAGVRGRCLKYCGICCMQCRCVPSGTFGNRDECPCYRDMLNSKKKPKCP